MTDLSRFPIMSRWPAQYPDRLQLYSFPTPNGIKVSAMLEEIGIPYEPHTVFIGKDETWTPEFLSLNPNGKIPAIIDPDGPGGRPLPLFESGAILLYQIPRVVVGENRSFVGDEDHLRARGVEVVVLDDPECFELMQRFIAAHPELWHEDIGE
jgi:hypothetical protein